MTKESAIKAPEGEMFAIKKGEPIKNSINKDTLFQSGQHIKEVYASFDIDAFIDSTMDETWEELELMQRGKQITLKLHEFLPADYEEALTILVKVADNYSSGMFVMGLSLPDYVAQFGQNEKYWALSMSALSKFTVYWSSEMAVRPFIINYEKRMMEQMYAWSKDKNEHVRRLSSEGCRPALPWAQALPSFKKDPAPVIKILEQLKADPSVYVRKSVANNLNDISKTHPDLVISIAKDWYGDNEDTDWIVKHACRTLLKSGNPDALSIFGYSDINSIKTDNFVSEKAAISIGDDLTFSFDISTKEDSKIRLEYAIDYVKSNGKRNRKIFKISEIDMKKGTNKHYTKKQSFEDVSTRKHYPGVHTITLIVNGVEQGSFDFELKK